MTTKKRVGEGFKTAWQELWTVLTVIVSSLYTAFVCSGSWVPKDEPWLQLNHPLVTFSRVTISNLKSLP